MEVIRIFVSYAREDKRWLLLEHPLALIPWLAESLRKDVVFWYDEQLNAGDVYRRRIEEEIDHAHIAMLIVSQAFLNSTFIEEVELLRIKARAERKELQVVPILVGSCSWEENDFLNARQMLPGKPTPLIKYTKDESDWDQVRYEILADLKKRIKGIRASNAEAGVHAKKSPESTAVAPAVEMAEASAGDKLAEGISQKSAKPRVPAKESPKIVPVEVAAKRVRSSTGKKLVRQSRSTRSKPGSPSKKCPIPVAVEGTATNKELAFVKSLCEAEKKSANRGWDFVIVRKYSLGTAKGNAEAIKCYRKAHDGNAKAQSSLGDLYSHGSKAKAAAWYRRAAERGYAKAQHRLGMVLRDKYETVEWYRKAADRGYAPAQCSLGSCYKHGWGVGRNEEEAVKWYRKAADQGDAEARAKLERMGGLSAKSESVAGRVNGPTVTLSAVPQPEKPWWKLGT